MTKYKVLSYVPEKYALKTQLYSPEMDIKFPVVFKDNYCTTNGQGVQLINSKEEMDEYLKNNGNSIIVQEYNDYAFEFGISYERYPFNYYGKTISCMDTTGNRACHLQKDYNELTGNCSTRQNFINCNHLITPKLSKAIDYVSKSIPGFYVGRYDVKAKSYDELMNGNFKVIELNGVCGNNLDGGCGTMCRLKRMMFGFVNIMCLRAYNPNKMTVIMYKSLERGVKCKWSENFFTPSSSD
jgi:hypothetical protein